MAHIDLELLDEIGDACARGEREWPIEWTRIRPRFDAFTMVGVDEYNDMPRGDGSLTSDLRVAMATDGQIKFIASLMHVSEDDVRAMKLTKKDATKKIDRLKIDNVPLATEGQMRFITSMIAEKDTTGIDVALMDAVANNTLTIKQASPLIDMLKACPVTATAPAINGEFDTICAELVKLGNRYGARFAINNLDGAANSISFWNVKEWNGRYFVKQIIGGGSEDGHTTRLNADARLSVVRRIAEDPKAAMIMYGMELGRCGHCNRTLTKDSSRAQGMGDWCAGHHG